jgi:hypothetical protein
VDRGEIRAAGQPSESGSGHGRATILAALVIHITRTFVDQIDLLLVLAQIGVGVAGFASMATVVGQAYVLGGGWLRALRNARA